MNVLVAKYLTYKFQLTTYNYEIEYIMNLYIMSNMYVYCWHIMCFIYLLYW